MKKKILLTLCTIGVLAGGLGGILGSQHHANTPTPTTTTATSVQTWHTMEITSYSKAGVLGGSWTYTNEHGVVSKFKTGYGSTFYAVINSTHSMSFSWKWAPFSYHSKDLANPPLVNAKGLNLRSFGVYDKGTLGFISIGYQDLIYG